MKPLSQALEEAFEQFFRAYPKRPEGNPKAAARLAFAARVREGADPEQLVKAAGAFAQEFKARGLATTFIPHARTWLGQRRYEDYLAAPAEPVPAEPEHPLAWLKPELGETAWGSWIAPLRVTPGEPIEIAARTQFAIDRIRQEGWAARIERQLGSVAWVVARQETA